MHRPPLRHLLPILLLCTSPAASAAPSPPAKGEEHPPASYALGAASFTLGVITVWGAAHGLDGWAGGELRYRRWLQPATRTSFPLFWLLLFPLLAARLNALHPPGDREQGLLHPGAEKELKTALAFALLCSAAPLLPFHLRYKVRYAERACKAGLLLYLLSLCLPRTEQGKKPPVRWVNAPAVPLLQLLLPQEKY